MVLKNKGNAIISFVLAIIIFGGLSLMTINFIKSRASDSDTEIIALQAKVLAEDIVELGKYYLLYEKIVFIDNPLILNAERRKILDDFARQAQGAASADDNLIVNACGGYDSELGDLGDLKAGESEVLCPYYVRNATLSGTYLEELFLKMWSTNKDVTVIHNINGTLEKMNGVRKAIFEEKKAGEYSVTLNLSAALERPDEQFIRLHIDPNILRRFIKEGISAKLIFTFYSAGAGYEDRSNNRYVKIKSEVQYGLSFFKTRALASDSLVLQPATLKDFSLFMIFPENADGTRTRKFSEAFKVNGENTVINGRVLFHGDLDLSIDKLPTFNELVVISGDFTGAEGLSPEKYRMAIKDKFKKGLIVRFPIERLVNDGECVAGNPQMNQTGMYCFKPRAAESLFSISDYIENLGNLCANIPVNVENGNFEFEAKEENLVRSDLCKGNSSGGFFIANGIKDVNVFGTHAFLMTPIKTLKIGKLSNIYGTVIGGNIEAADGAKFFSLNSLRVGLPGIAGKTDLTALLDEAQGIQAGVGVPLLNMPFVKKFNYGR